MIQISWHGHATFSLKVGDINIVVDPFLDNNPASRASVYDTPADFVLQTHGHGDHIGDTVDLVTHTQATVIANAEIATWLQKQGCEKAHAMNTGGSYTFPFGRVKMTPALHSSSLPDGSYGGDPGGFVVSAEGKNIYFAGDTAVFSDMSLIGRMGIDVAVLPIGDNYTMGPEDSLLAIDFIKPKHVIPGHYGTWPIISIDIDEWTQSVMDNTEATPIVLSPGETWEL